MVTVSQITIPDSPFARVGEEGKGYQEKEGGERETQGRGAVDRVTGKRVSGKGREFF